MGIKAKIFLQEKNNLTFILNGLGDLPGDIILVLYENKIYKYQLKWLKKINYKNLTLLFHDNI